MIENLNPDMMNILGIILVVGVGWIILRFIFKLARKVFQLGCLAIVIIGAIVLIAQYLQ